MMTTDSAPGGTPTSPKRVAGAGQGITLAFAGFLPVMGIVSLAPAVPTILEHFQSVPNANLLVPLMVTTPGLMIALLAPFAGWIVDRYGRRLPILLATFAYGFFGSAPFFLNDLPTIFASRLAVGVSEAFILTIVNALFADYFGVAERRKWITVQGVLGPVLGTGTIAASGMLTGTYWNGAFLIYLAAFLIFAAMVIWFYEPERQLATREENAAAGDFPWRTAAVYCGVTVFVSTMYYVFIVQAGLAFDAIGSNSSGRLGMLIGLSSIGVPIGALLFNFLSRRRRSEQVIATVLSFFAIGMIGMGLANDERVMVGFGFVQQIGSGMAVTSLIFWVSQLLPPQHRGRGFGFWTCAFFLGQFASPAIFALVHDATGSILSAFIVMGSTAMVGSATLLVLGRRVPGPAETRA